MEGHEDRGRLKTNIDGLDERMEGGIPAGHVILLCGESGSLKTSLAWNMMYNFLKEGGKALYFTLEQSRQSLLRTAVKLGMDPAPYEDSLAVVDLAFLRRVLKQNASAGGPDWFTSLNQQLRAYQEEGDFELVVLDSLEALYAVSEMENPRNALYHFFAGLKDLGLTALLVSEMPEAGSSFGSCGIESFLADGVIHLNMERLGHSVGRYIRIVKMREVKHATDYFPLLVDEKGFRIVTR